MIKINLLALRVEQRGVDLRVQAAIAAVVLLIVAGVCYSFYSSLADEVASTKQQIISTENETKRLQTIIGEIDKIKERKEDLQKKLDVIDELEKSRLDTVMLMEAVAEATPEPLWMQSLELKGNRVALSGLAIDNQIIAKLIQNLQANPQISGVVLSETVRGQEAGMDIVKFSLQFSYKPPRDKQKRG